MDNKILIEVRQKFRIETGEKVASIGKVYSLEYSTFLQKELVVLKAQHKRLISLAHSLTTTNPNVKREILNILK